MMTSTESTDKSGACPWAKSSCTTPVTSPWVKASVNAPAPCSLEEVMSEQLALEAAAAAPDNFQSDAELAARLAAAEAVGDPNDEAIARYLQREFDKEYDAMVDQVERKYNGTSKVSISFENYKMKHQREAAGVECDEDDDDDYDAEFPEFPTATNWETVAPQMGQRGYAGQGKNIVTKHDKVICGRRNAERLMEVW
ncbi:serine/threonine-protein kinase rio3-like [Plakobranchus ocellatus]|uniref:Serine/threonine-protein kinase rio3-like n=1 Tax=Plakobranchus ocellatus TaxID=259542 RepID=A0AAV4BJP2_9GAST|nr:serine/threonine-protein kinase rio3-like [Plakobranchus ocellatus]